MNWKRLFITWIIVAIGFYFLSSFFKKPETAKETPKEGISIETSKESYTMDQEVMVKMENGTIPATYEFACPSNPFKVFDVSVSPPVELKAETQTPCEKIEQTVNLKSGEKKLFSLVHWNHAFFGKTGKFKIEIPFVLENKETATASTPEFSVEERGVVKAVGYKYFYRPIYNGLVYLTDAIPGKNLGVGIVILTLLIRIILLLPSQHAMRSQKRMQELQPKLEHIKKKYAGNQEKVAKETMELWKKEKVNPFGSCLPLLVQFPILIALFYVIRTGLSPDSAYILYEPLKNINFLDIGSRFLWLDLTAINTMILPLTVGLLQFGQMKLAMAKKQPSQASGKGSEMEIANKLMVYVLPVMIAIFTASVPGGVGLYWGVSTIFGIGQQLVVNRESSKRQIEN